MLLDHDVHIHTTISPCSIVTDMARVDRYIEEARKAGLKTIGITDHIWDVAGGDDLHKSLTLERILSVKNQIPPDVDDIRIMVGAEAEVCGGKDKISISRERACNLEYLLIPVSHIDAPSFDPEDKHATLKDIARLMVKRFHIATSIDAGTFVAIPHPFMAVGYKPMQDEILSYISEDEFSDCFGRAAEKNISIEIHMGSFPEILGQSFPGFQNETFIRILGIAKRMGCRFHFGSDSHSDNRIRLLPKLEEYAKKAGITKEDMHPYFSGLGK